MKKKNCFIKFIAIAILTFGLVAPSCFVQATTYTNSQDWILSENGQSITHGEHTYVAMELLHPFIVDPFKDYKHRDLSYANSYTEKMYNSSYIYITEGAEEFAIEVALYRNNEYFGYFLFVEETYYDDFLLYKHGLSNSYGVTNPYDTSYFFSSDVYSRWADGTELILNVNELQQYSCYNLFACDQSQIFRFICGLVARDNDTNDLYLLKYDEYEPHYFDEEGLLYTSLDHSVTLYKLEDEAFAQQLITILDTNSDDLDWLVSDAFDKTLASIFAAFLFAFIPGVLIIATIVMLFVVKDKKYKRCWIAILTSSIITIVSFLVMWLLIS